MLGNDYPLLPDYKAISVSLDLDRTPNGAGGDGVFVGVKADKAGLGDRGRQSMKAVKAASDRHKRGPLQALSSS